MYMTITLITSNYLLIIYKVLVFTKNTAIDSKMSKIFNAASESCAFFYLSK